MFQDEKQRKKSYRTTERSALYEYMHMGWQPSFVSCKRERQHGKKQTVQEHRSN